MKKREREKKEKRGGRKTGISADSGAGVGVEGKGRGEEGTAKGSEIN